MLTQYIFGNKTEAKEISANDASKYFSEENLNKLSSTFM